MNTLSLIMLFIISCIGQMITINKTKKKVVKFLPIIISSIGIFIGIIIYLYTTISYEFKFTSQSVLSENYFRIIEKTI